MRIQRLTLWSLLCAWIITGAVLSIMLGRIVGNGQMLMPLDDVYIHFQYVRQLADGQAYVYNPGEPATSGATSFLYPYVLVLGYQLGFQGMALGEWAVIVGWSAMAVTLVGAWRLLGLWGASWPMRVVASVVIATGAFAWHFNSGMETGIVMTSAIWTLYGFAARRWGVFAGWGVVLALIRPEASAMAAWASVLAFLIHGVNRRWSSILLLLPLLACAIQPLVNYAVTGSLVASGNQSKSILGTLPPDLTLMVTRILQNLIRMWSETLLGAGDGLALAITGVVGLLVVWRYSRVTVLLIVGWLLGVSLAISTLDNAFWHFKRYQMPLLLVLVVLAFAVLQQLPVRLRAVVASIVIVSQVISTGMFVRYQALNLSYVARQPLAMAEWLRTNTAPDAQVAVHDVGLMRYAGERATLDMVGLTSPDAAIYWRNGVGSVAELLLGQQPDYVASYGSGHGYGLARLESTLLLSEPAATFRVPLDSAANVALAAEVQHITQPDYRLDAARLQAIPASRAMRQYLDEFQAGTVPAAWLNVADITSEASYDYEWHGASTTGFLTDVFQQPLLGEDLVLVDGVRRLQDGETFRFDVPAEPRSALLVSRVHAAGSGSLVIRVNEVTLATRVLIDAPGYWQEFVTVIPAAMAVSPLQVETQATLLTGEYAPASHFLYWVDVPSMEEVVGEAVFGHDEFALKTFTWDVVNGALAVSWSVGQVVSGDVRMFVHVYDDLSQPPVVQWDGYPLGGLPAGNWLPGMLFDTITLATPQLDAGEYTLAIGFYDAQTGERVSVTATDMDVRDNRLILAQWTVPNG